LVDPDNPGSKGEGRLIPEGLAEHKTGELQEEIDLAAETMMSNITEEPIPARIKRLARTLEEALKAKDGLRSGSAPTDPLD